MHSILYMSAYSLKERWSSYMQYAALYIDGEYVGHPDWIERGECVSCFIFNTKNKKLNSPPTTMMKFWFIKIYF